MRLNPEWALHEEGARLGLAIAKWGAEAHGGRLEPGCPSEGGCLFRLLLPSGAGSCPRPAHSYGAFRNSSGKLQPRGRLLRRINIEWALASCTAAISSLRQRGRHYFSQAVRNNPLRANPQVRAQPSTRSKRPTSPFVLHRSSSTSPTTTPSAPSAITGRFRVR